MLLGPTFMLGGLAAIASVPIVGWVGAVGLGDGFVAIVALATLAFVAPAAILSAVGPMIVRATLTDVATSGSIVGRLSAIGTVGAITGTFVTGFVLLGLVPTSTLIVAVGGLLVVIGLALTLAHAGRRRTAGRGPCHRRDRSWAVSRSPVPRHATPRAPTTASRSSPTATTWTGGPSSSIGSPTRTSTWPIRPSSASATSSASPTRPVHTWTRSTGRSTSSTSVAAASPSRATWRRRAPVRDRSSSSWTRGCSRSPASSSGSRRTMRCRSRVGDARRSIEALPTDAFDLVVGDAFGGLAVPWHLTTTEFLGEIQRVLRPGGMYVMNLIDYPPLGFVRAEAATASRLFDHVAVIAPPATLADRNGGNVVLVASAEPLDVAAVTARIGTWGRASDTGILADPGEVDAFIGDAPILTDDYAPVDQLLGR